MCDLESCHQTAHQLFIQVAYWLHCKVVLTKNEQCFEFFLELYRTVTLICKTLD